MDIDWGTKIITVYKSDMTDLGGSEYELDLDAFRLALRAEEDNVHGISYPKTHDHVTELDVGGLILARTVNILAPYTITFEAGSYIAYLVGANSNVHLKVNVNGLIIVPNNSAGLASASAMQNVIWDAQMSDHKVVGSMGAAMAAHYQGNLCHEYTVATVQDANRNVDVGRLDYVTIKVKAEDDVDWSSPLSTKVLYYHYESMGGYNPIKVGEDA